MGPDYRRDDSGARLLRLPIPPLQLPLLRSVSRVSGPKRHLNADPDAPRHDPARTTRLEE